VALEQSALALAAAGQAEIEATIATLRESTPATS
jgi:hypothetical protein